MSNASHSSHYFVPDPPTPTKFTLESPRGAKLATRTWWWPESDNQRYHSKPKALVLLVHGAGWHSGYFAPLATRLVQDCNVFCASYDMVCHGYSEPEPMSPNGCFHINTFDDLVEDVYAALSWAQQEAGYTNLPTFLLGESFGGMVALEAALQSKFYLRNVNDKNTAENTTSLRGVICCSAVLEVNPEFLPPNFVIQVLTWLCPYYPRTRMPAVDFSQTYDQAFGDPQWAAITRTDPKVQISPSPTLGGAVASLSTGKKVLAQANKFPCPLLVLHAKQDCRAMVAPMQQFVDQMPPNVKAEGVWLDDTTGHQLLQDKPEVTERVMCKISDWINQQLS